MYRAMTPAIASKARVKTSSSAALNADNVRLCYYDEAWRAIAWVLHRFRRRRAGGGAHHLGQLEIKRKCALGERSRASDLR
jgi:hypothetical protein